MKVSVIAVAALSAASTNAIAIAIALAEANPSPKAWCFWKGEPCWKAKRAAEAFSDALQSSGPYKQSRAADISNHPGGAAFHAKRAFGELAALVASAYDSPEEMYTDLKMGGHFGPDTNLTITRPSDGSGEPASPPEGESSDLAARGGAATGVDARSLFGKREATPWCFWKGEPCWKRGVEMSKREAEANPWCFWKGEPCWKRSDESLSAVERRSAQPAFCPFAGGEAGGVCYPSKRAFVEADRRACEQPGEVCHKARSVAEALIRAIEAPDEKAAKRDITAESDNIEARWCFWKGEPCWKRSTMEEVVARCNGPSGACTAARRDLTSMHAAARNLLDNLDAEVL